MKIMFHFTTTFLCAVICSTLLFSQSPLVEVEGNAYIKDRLGINVLQPSNSLHIGAGHAGGITIQRLIGNAQQINWKDAEGNLSAAMVHNFTPPGGVGNSDLTWYINGKNRLRLDQSGNLALAGFGNAQDPVKLSVNGNIAIGEIFDGETPPPGGAIIEGNVGIGTFSPASKLHVVAPGSQEMIFETPSGGYIGLTSQNSSASFFTGISAGHFSIFDNFSGERFMIDDEGHIGIGTAQPAGKVHIEDGRLVISSPSFNSDIFLRNTNDAVTGDGISGTIISNHAFAGLSFYNVENEVKATEAMLRLTEGNIEARINSVGHALTVRNRTNLTGASGIEVDLNVPSLTPTNHFMTFSHQGKVRGKIHGQETLTSLSRGLINDLLGDSPVEDDPTTASESRDQGAIAGNDNAFFNFIGTNYGQELCWHTIEFVESIIILIANSFSVLDPDDYAACSYEVISRGIKLWAFLAIEELTAGIAYESEGADYAEWLPKADTLEILNPGDVVGVIGGKVSKTFQEADQFMVISHQPMVVGNMPEDQNENAFEKIAFIGQVPVKTLGEVQVGDYILPSGNGDGYAIAVSNQAMKALDYQRIIGIAWSASDSTKRVNLINTAIGVNSNDLANVIDQMQSVMNAMQKALKRLDPQFEMALYDVQESTSTETIQKEYTTTLPLNEILTQDLGDFLTQQQHTADEQRQVVFASIQEELLAQGFDFSYFPFLEEMLTNPNVENMEKAKVHYDHVFSRMNNLLSSIGK